MSWYFCLLFGLKYFIWAPREQPKIVILALGSHYFQIFIFLLLDIKTYPILFFAWLFFFKVSVSIFANQKILRNRFVAVVHKGRRYNRVVWPKRGWKSCDTVLLSQIRKKLSFYIKKSHDSLNFELSWSWFGKAFKLIA